DRFGDPPGELFHRSAHGRLGDRLEFLNEPPLELGSGSSRTATTPACSSRLRRWLVAISVPAMSRP
ncbi:MAG TPA: hypothetical protein VEX40_17110, partial [Mycobacterium sp.]|nr:hypothetical protein [Mycobacterium sp.]